MTPKVYHPAFNGAQLDRLRELGVLDAQIARLLAALPVCESLFEKVPAMALVRDELLELERALAATSKRLARLLNPMNRPDSRLEARARIHMESSGDADEMEAALSAINVALIPLRAARDGLPREQRRSREASPMPVSRIDEALTAGWGDAFYKTTDGEVHAGFVAVPDYPFGASISPTSRFRQVVGVCYDAFLGDADRDPERAIKAYIAWKNKQRRASSAGHDGDGTAGDQEN